MWLVIANSCSRTWVYTVYIPFSIFSKTWLRTVEHCLFPVEYVYYNSYIIIIIIIIITTIIIIIIILTIIITLSLRQKINLL